MSIKCVMSSEHSLRVLYKAIKVSKDIFLLKVFFLLFSLRLQNVTGFIFRGHTIIIYDIYSMRHTIIYKNIHVYLKKRIKV